MKQVLQDLRSGRIELTDIPCPSVPAGHLLVQSAVSLISPGTERMLVEFGQAGLLGKARAQPERVREVWTKVRTDGVGPALDAVRRRLDEPFALGYSNVGRVLEIGAGVRVFAVGDRVVSNGPHAEVVCVPVTLAAAVPPGVDDDAAAFTVTGAIALNGIRLLEPTLGEHVVVIGLGLLGMLSVQLLRAHGCRVLGIDVNPARCDLARSFGCEVLVSGNGLDVVQAAQAFSRGRGVDGVLIAAAAKTDEIVRQAANMCRRKGRIVLIGVVGLNLRRADFYEKELSFQVACSYGPGRYDRDYERGDRDYPLPYVRWTAARNFEAVLDMLADGRLDVASMISRRVAQTDAARAYEIILHDPDALGVLLTYPEVVATSRAVALSPTATASSPTASPPSVPIKPVIGMIGAGAFARQTLLPGLRVAGAVIEVIASARGVSGVHAARAAGAAQATSDYRDILRSPTVTAVFIATPHDSHPRIVAEALDAGKHVFVEKPLAIDPAGLELVRHAQARHPHLQLMVGFNRRFAPHTRAVQRLLYGRTQPIAVRMLVNAGALPAEHWTRDPQVGGGRVIGEGCHFIDLALCLVGHPIISVQAARMGTAAAGDDDTMAIDLTFADGSLVVIQYWTNGSKAYPKEEIDVFSAGRVVRIDNWRALRAFGWPGVARMRIRQDKGHRATIAAFLDRVATGGPPLIPFPDIDAVTSATFAALESAATGCRVELQRDTPQSLAPDADVLEERQWR